MGHVAAPFGVKGWLKVFAYTEARDGLFDYSDWWLGRGDDWRPVEVEDAQIHGKALVAKLAGVDDRSAAEPLKGLEIAVPRDQLEAAGEDEYYWMDLVGLEVVNRSGERLGEVAGLLETGANDVLRVTAERERLIPFVGAIVLDVDLGARRILVDWGADY